MLTAAKPPWPRLKQVAMEGSSAMPVTTVSTGVPAGKYTSYIMDHPKASTIYALRCETGPLSFLGPTLEHWKSALPNSQE